MDVRMREVPAQVVVTEQRMVDQQSLERWLPEAMARVHKTAGSMAAGTAEQPRVEPAAIPARAIVADASVKTAPGKADVKKAATRKSAAKPKGIA